MTMPAYILAGGRSRRFGRDKARALLRGRPLITNVSERLRGLGHPVCVVARREGEYGDLGLMTIADIEPDQGPVGGLRTALTHRGDGWLLLCSCDMIDVDERWIEALLTRGDRAPHADAVVARDRIWQPFPGLYHTRLLHRSELRSAPSLQRLLDSVAVDAIDAERLPAIRQANTEVELRRAQRDRGPGPHDARDSTP